LIGEVLANPIYTENGALYLNKGNQISDRVITNLKKMGVSTIYVEDGNDEITLQEVLPTPIKIQIIQLLKETFKEIKDREYVDDKKVNIMIKNIMDNMNVYENAVLISNLVPNDKLSKMAIHALDVTVLSIIIGIKKKYNEDKLTKLGMATLLHDIGKLFSDSREHTKIGQELVKGNRFFSSTVYMAIYYLYEREDGSGPHGISGEKLHEYVKILSMCNEYANNISGKDAILPHEAIEKITAKAIIKFDKEICKDFIDSIYCYPTGLQVKINNGLSGIVVMQNQGATTSPVIAINENGAYHFCNLIDESNLTLFIEEVIL
jgi:HD-GYP domain-containing protein (c-di-GMP phosphodiesterase class II)